MKTRSLLLLFCFVLLPFFSKSQETEIKSTTGLFQLGMRSTISVFGDEGFTGLGAGGQFRIKFGERLNTEWFADYITTDLGGLGKRIDNHIGWSVMYYPLNTDYSKGKFVPYILAGHCFDYTIVRVANDASRNQSRWSSAVQAGLGTHYLLSDNFDISLSTQYMSHLGKTIGAEVIDNPVSPGEYLYVSRENAGLEGHLLFTLSLNVTLGNLWKSKS